MISFGSRFQPALSTTAQGPWSYFSRGVAASARRRLRWLAAARRFRSRRHCDHHRISATSHSRISNRWIRRRRTSGTVICGSFPPAPLGVRGTPWPAGTGPYGGATGPAPRLVLIQATLPLGRLDVLFDRPPRGAHLRHLLEWHFRRSIRAVVFQLRLLPQRSPSQQPLARARQAFLAEPCPGLRVLVDPWPLAPLATVTRRQPRPAGPRQLGPPAWTRRDKRLGIRRPRLLWQLLGGDHARFGGPDAGIGRASSTYHLPSWRTPWTKVGLSP